MSLFKRMHRSTKPFRRAVKRFFMLPVTVPRNLVFFWKHRHLRGVRTILYAITPPPRWKDIGDHAQVVAIRCWLDRHYPGVPVLEMDKDRSRLYLPALKRLIGRDDLILLHSGGNMGDRAMWSESIRRLIIRSFPGTKVVSLPQTIFFSDTPRGRTERENTRRIYAGHPDLTIIARDPQSEDHARELFPHAVVDCMPDFVLSLTPKHTIDRHDPPGVLLVLRSDNEAFLTPEQRTEIERMIPYSCTYYDNVHDTPVAEDERDAVLDGFLDRFREADAVVTDRFHGLIFAVICRRPCVALRSIDHKIVSGRHWFGDIPFVRFATDVSEVPGLLEECLAAPVGDLPDYNVLHFDRIPGIIGWSAGGGDARP